MPPLLLLGLLGLAAPAQALTPPAGGLESKRQSWVIDHTRSGLGGEFFRAFAQAWRHEDRGNFVISVEEQMGQKFTHQINIWVGNRLLLQTQLHPNQRGNLGHMAASAVEIAAQRLRQWQSPGEVTL
ncbi:MAG: Curli assembly protein CsgE [Moraxellaceae bacterium]|jgi:hypothetical protein|nr:Curli assembly protein CsgE [Moraxellaceae bacterium]